MKQDELRALATCAQCGKKIGETKVPIFWKIVTECHALDGGAILRQAGLEMLLGGNALLASHMGPDEDMTKILDKSRTFMICSICAPEVNLVDTVAAISAKEAK